MRPYAIGLINAALSCLILLLSEKRERDGGEEGCLFLEQWLSNQPSFIFIQLSMRKSHLTGISFQCRYPDSHNFDPCWENSDLSVLLPDGIYLLSEALAKIKIFEPNLTNNTATISLPLSLIVTSLTKFVCRCIVGGEIRSPMKHCPGCLQNLLQPIRSTAQIWIVTKIKIHPRWESK